ncbi:hypothetical protein [Anatilimnocola floriformis]|uniref:hypothetical protein n=1 Tax=Anatilimnocola floriformis TaxID=2948575 RepID=UPI0020C1BF78|nr:hypothetical protein [Anatilimnocola floriformis]
MNLRLSRTAASLLVIAAALLIAGRCWAVFVPLGSSPDEWGLKYDMKVTAAEGDKVNVLFTLADEGRLKPVYTITLVAFHQNYDGSRTYLAQAPIAMKPTKDGGLEGQTQVSKEVIDRTQIRILTLSVDGKRQNVAASYYIPLKRFLTKAPAATSPSAAPESSAAPSTVKVPVSR